MDQLLLSIFFLILIPPPSSQSRRRHTQHRRARRGLAGRAAGRQARLQRPVSRVRRQSQRLPLRLVDVRELQGLLQAHRAKQKALLVRRQATVSNRQASAQAVRLLPLSEVSPSGHEAGGSARESRARRSQQVRSALQTQSRSQAANTQAAKRNEREHRRPVRLHLFFGTHVQRRRLLE